MFSISAGACAVRPLKAGSPHISVKSDYIELTYFSGVKHAKIMESDVKKKLVFEINVSHFKGKEYIKGLVRDFLYDGRTGKSAVERIFANAVARTNAEPARIEPIGLNTDEIKALIAKKMAECPYGLCMIASDRRTLRFYEELNGLNCDLFYPSSRNLSNTLIVSPAPDSDLGGYRDFIFLDTPSDFNLPSIEKGNAWVNHEICGYKMFENIDVSRERLLEIFAALRRDVNALCGNTAEEIAAFCDGLGFDRLEFIFALCVFEQLGLVAFENGRLTVYRGVKTELNDSPIYRKVSALQQR